MGTVHSEECSPAVGRARLPSFSHGLERACVASWPCVRLAGFELLVTVLLARNRLPMPTVAADVPHADFVAELISLPSGLLAMVCEAMVCEAIMQLKARLGAAGARALQVGCTGHGRGPTRSRRVRGQGQCSRLESGRALSTSGTDSSSRTHFRFPIWTRE